MLSIAWLTIVPSSFAQDTTAEKQSSDGASTEATSSDSDQDQNPANQDKGEKANHQEKTAEVPETLKFKMKTIDGEEVDLSRYAGKVVVIVNTASRCGMTPQYAELQKLHEKYSDQGVVILGFPCNQFGGQEPGTEADIKSFCSKNYGVEFDMFSKVDVNGDQACDLFKLLTSVEAKPAGAGNVRWNFEKFVLDKSGKLAARFGSRVKPSSKEFVEFLEEQIAVEKSSKDE
jgi:glutathione peroxidase